MFLLFTKIIYLEEKIIYLSIRSSLGLGTGHYLSPGRRGEGFGAKQGEIYPIPPLNVTSLKWSPLITFDDFRNPPLHVIISKQIWAVPPLNPSKVFSDPPFCSPKNQVIPAKLIPRLRR